MAVERAPRILLTADTVGGVWSYAVELARELDRRGLVVAIASMGAPLSPAQRAQLAATPRVQLFESHWKLEWMQDCWRDVEAAGDWLLALERTFQPDIVHLNQYAFGALPFRAPTLVVAHSCVLSWWHAVHGEDAPPAWDRYRDRVRRGLAGAGLVAAPTRAMLDALGVHYGCRTPALVLPNAASAADFAPAPKQPVVLAAGRFWDAAKNLAALQQAAPGLPWTVRVAGSCSHPDGGTLRPRGVQCLGELPRAQLAGELAGAAIYALPARYEPFGLSVLEAALSGCALVLGDIASLRETWSEAACYVPPADPGALRATLQRLIAQPAARERLAQAALARAQHFTPQRQGDNYLAAYARLAPQLAAHTGEEAACA